MSRLERHQKKELRTTIIFFTLTFLVTLYLILTWGIKILLNTSVFVANLKDKKNRSPLLKKNDVYALINIDSIPTATNSAKIIITGSLFNLTQLEFYLNGEKVKEKNFTSSDNFSEEIGELKEGNNEIYVKGKSENGKIVKQTKKFSVFYKNSPPQLTIHEPEDKKVTSQPEIKIKGSTDKETLVKINDLPVVVDAFGNFETTLFLKQGENIITIIAEDQAGNRQEKIVTLTYQP